MRRERERGGEEEEEGGRHYFEQSLKRLILDTEFVALMWTMTMRNKFDWTPSEKKVCCWYSSTTAFQYYSRDSLN